MSKILAQIAGKIVTILGYDGTAFRNILVDELGRLELADMAFRVGLHASTHEDAGDDEINVDGLSGELADDQPALAHLLGGAKHTADSLADLNTKVNDATLDDEGDPRDPNAHAASHQNGGADEISVAGLSGDLADEQDPKDHAANHEYGGGDAPSLAQLGGTMAHFEFIIDGGGAVIEAGEKGHIEIPWPCTLSEVCLFADQSGNIVVDIWKDAVGNFPPTNADTITSITPPTLTAADHVSDSTLTDWTTAFAARHILAFNVDSCVTIERVTVSLRVQKVAG